VAVIAGEEVLVVDAAVTVVAGAPTQTA